MCECVCGGVSCCVTRWNSNYLFKMHNSLWLFVCLLSKKKLIHIFITIVVNWFCRVKLLCNDLNTSYTHVCGTWVLYNQRYIQSYMFHWCWCICRRHGIVHISHCSPNRTIHRHILIIEPLIKLFCAFWNSHLTYIVCTDILEAN